METLDKVHLGVEQAEADEIPELYDKRPDWPQAEAGHSPMTTQFPESVPHSQCCKWATVILYSTPLVPSPGFRDWVASTFCGLVETMMHNQSWQEITLLLPDQSLGFWKAFITTTNMRSDSFMVFPKVQFCPHPTSLVLPINAILESIMTSTRSGQ